MSLRIPGRFLLLAAAIIVLAGCSLPAAFHRAPVATVRLFETPAEPISYELPSGAVATWRGFKKNKPALVLFAAHPMLEPVAETARDEVRRFIKDSSHTELVRRGSVNAADTLFLSTQTVSAAIDAGLISELVYVMPTSVSVEKMSLTDFQQRAFHAGFLSEAEALALTQQDGVISGTVRGIPFRCVHPQKLPQIGKPVLVHIDLGYFHRLYSNDVKTPVYELLQKAANVLRAANYATLAVTLSYSNQEAEFGLESRFLISNLADLIRRPSLFEGGTPPSWKLRADALYAGALFAEDTAESLNIQAATTNPDDPAAVYMYALILLEKSQIDEAIAAINHAVTIDPGYALAYLDIAEAKGLLNLTTEQAGQLLDRAARAFPDNQFIRIKTAAYWIQNDHLQEARLLLQSLQSLAWSKTYHAGVPDLLQQMLAATDPAPSP